MTRPKAFSILLGYTMMHSTVRYLGAELVEALAIAEVIEIETTVRAPFITPDPALRQSQPVPLQDCRRF